MKKIVFAMMAGLFISGTSMAQAQCPSLSEAPLSQAAEMLSIFEGLSAQNLTYKQVMENHPEVVARIQVLSKSGFLMGLDALGAAYGDVVVFIRQSMRNLGTRSNEIVAKFPGQLQAPACVGK